MFNSSQIYILSGSVMIMNGLQKSNSKANRESAQLDLFIKIILGTNSKSRRKSKSSECMVKCLKVVIVICYSLWA